MTEPLQLVLEIGQRREVLACVGCVQSTSKMRQLRFEPRDADSVALPPNLCITRRGAGVWAGNVEQLALDFGGVPLYAKLRLEVVPAPAVDDGVPEPMFRMDLDDSGFDSALRSIEERAATTRAEWLCGALDLLPFDDQKTGPQTDVPFLSAARPSPLVSRCGIPAAAVSWATARPALPEADAPPVVRTQRRRRAGTSPPTPCARAHSLSVARGERVADPQPLCDALTDVINARGGTPHSRVFRHDVCGVLDRRGHFRLGSSEHALVECAVHVTRGRRVGELFAIELRSAVVTMRTAASVAS